MAEQISREEHVQWCKDRAMEYIKKGDINQGLTSMFSDLKKHEKTREHPAIQIGLGLMMIGNLGTASEAEKFIQGFN